MASREIQIKSKRYASNVGDLLSGRVFLKFSPSAPIEGIVREMQLHNLGVAAIVSEQDELIGLLTERDILRKIFGFYGETYQQYNDRKDFLSIYPNQLLAWDAMVVDPKFLYSDESIESALARIKEFCFRYMPVLEGKDKKIVGIVSERELFSASEELAKRKIDSQSTMLSYMMHHEDYGRASAASIDFEN